MVYCYLILTPEPCRIPVRGSLLLVLIFFLVALLFKLICSPSAGNAKGYKAPFLTFFPPQSLILRAMLTGMGNIPDAGAARSRAPSAPLEKDATGKITQAEINSILNF